MTDPRPPWAAMRRVAGTGILLVIVGIGALAADLPRALVSVAVIGVVLVVIAPLGFLLPASRRRQETHKVSFVSYVAAQIARRHDRDRAEGNTSERTRR